MTERTAHAMTSGPVRSGGIARRLSNASSEGGADLGDEPTASLDLSAVRAIEGLIERGLEEGQEVRTAVWVSHDLEQARRVSTRSLAMQSGRLGPEG
jgi:ABC-type phosphate transport system ATPase subunit